MATNELAARRKAHARAFLKQTLKPGHAWSEQRYSYEIERDGMTFLECYEDNPKKDTRTRLAEAAHAYAAKFGQPANLILVNERDAGATFAGCEIKADRRVRVNTYQVGRSDA